MVASFVDYDEETTQREPCDVFPCVPPEIMREILEFAASSSTDTALSLTRVSTFTRRWVAPMLYHTVVLSSSRTVSSFLHTITSSAAYSDSDCNLGFSTPLHQLVRNLGIFALGPLQSIESIISNCTNVQNFSCGFPVKSYTHMKEQSSFAFFTPPEQHLLGFSCRDGIDFSFVSTQTTHLHVQLSLQVFTSLLDIHEHLPGLTHLAVSLPVTATASWHLIIPTLASLLDKNTHLEVLFIQVARSSNIRTEELVARTEKEIVDHRLIITQAPMSSVAQWERTLIPAGAGLWYEAERKVRDRGQGVAIGLEKKFEEVVRVREAWA